MSRKKKKNSHAPSRFCSHCETFHARRVMKRFSVSTGVPEEYLQAYKRFANKGKE